MLALIFVAALFSWAGPASAQVDNRYALLIGVSQYPQGLPPLQGPKADVMLLRDQLERDGIKRSNIRILADSLPAGVSQAQPTHDAIVSAIERLAADVPAGAQVLIYYSGHGSYVPAANSTDASEEPDGTDEVLLPIDVGTWDPNSGEVGNSITDNELNGLIQKFANKKAFVWLVVDACHSATASRGAGATVRQASPSALGIPPDAFKAVSRTRGSGSSANVGGDYLDIQANGGGFVGFYAAYPDQKAIELALPQDAADATPHGLMTYHLVKAVRQNAAASYSDLALMIQAAFAATTGVLPGNVREMPIPFFEGDLEKRPFVGAGNGRDRQFQVRINENAVVIAGGRLDDVSRGSLFSLSRADTGAKQGTIRVTQAGAQSSLAELEKSSAISLADLKALAAPGECPEGCVLQASLVSKQTDFSVKVFPNLSQGSAVTNPIVQRALAALLAMPADQRPVAVEQARSATGADVELRLIGDQLWVLPPGAALPDGKSSRVPSVAVNDRFDGELLGAILRSVGRSLNVARVASALAPAPQTQAMSASLFLESVAERADGTCSFPGTYPTDVPSSARPVQAGTGATSLIEISHCQILYIRLRNQGDTALDVTPLYLEADYGIAYVGPVEAALTAPPQSTVVAAVPVVTRGAPAGFEQLVLFAIERPERASIPADLRRLQAPGISRLEQRTRSAGVTRSGNPLLKLYEDAAIGSGAVRSGQVGVSDANAGALRWSIHTIPQ